MLFLFCIAVGRAFAWTVIGIAIVIGAVAMLLWEGLLLLVGFVASQWGDA